MQSATFTKGPYKITGTTIEQDLGDRLGPTVARLAGSDTDPETLANLRLFKAAPDLVDALRNAEAEIHNPGACAHRGIDIAEQVRAALASLSH